MVAVRFTHDHTATFCSEVYTPIGTSVGSGGVPGENVTRPGDQPNAERR